MTPSCGLRTATLVTLLLLLTVDLLAQTGAKQVGGSNYITFSLGNYAGGDPCASSSTIQGVLTDFQNNPTLVEQQLQQMFSNGQRKISFVIYFEPSQNGTLSSGLCTDSSKGSPNSQLTSNLQNVLTLISHIGFNQVFIRFAYAGSPAISKWSSWNEVQYQQNWNFIIFTRLLIEKVLASSGVIRTYDLGLELGGLSAYSAEVGAYMTRLWTDYCSSTGCSDSYGFSIAWIPTRYPAPSDTTDGSVLTNQIYLLKQTGYPLPTMYGLDIYDNEESAFISAYNSLKLTGQSTASILVQEAYYNDRSTSDALYLAQAQVPLNVCTIIQWPYVRGGSIANFSVPLPALYEQYNSLPFISTITTYSSQASYWVSLKGTFPANSTVNLYPGSWSTGNIPIATFQMNGTGSAGGFLVPTSALSGNASLNVQVVNAQTGAYSDPALVSFM